MKTAETVFVVPTYRLRDVAETIEAYDEHFWSNGHSVKMMVFDDSSLANHQKYFSRLESTKTVNDLYYVGPREKEQFLAFLNKKLRDRKLESLVRNLFRPSYGGNRNFTLIYTLGAFLISADDDMRPYALVESSPESLKRDEISRGRLHKAGANGYLEKSYDILTSFKDVLGKRVGRPFRAISFWVSFPGLKPWAVLSSPFGRLRRLDSKGDASKSLQRRCE